MNTPKETIERVARQRTESRCRSAWGMSLSEYDAHVAIHGDAKKRSSPLSKYSQHKKNAKTRGISWGFTFPEWWAVWQESGKWDQRDKKRGYVMARRNDGDTPYSASTVYICTRAQNTRDGFISTPAHMRFGDPVKNFGNPAGCGLGYRVSAKGGPNPYVASFRKKHLGNFPAPELARAAYLAAFEEYKRTQP